MTCCDIYDTILVVKTVKQTAEYRKWYNKLSDVKTKARIDVRIQRLAMGYAGDAKAIDTNVTELRFHFGPGYRVYFTERRGEIVILLAGGDKSTQEADIRKAIALCAGITED